MRQEKQRHTPPDLMMQPGPLGFYDDLTSPRGMVSVAFQGGEKSNHSHRLHGTAPTNQGPSHAMGKQVMDYGLGTLAILFLSPLLLVISIAIMLDSPGPVFFRQPRRGLNNSSFMVFKFRSMHAHMADIHADRQTSRDDPRVTRVGKWLRRLSLDELPQLFNVVRGEMSLVGPRPHALNTRVEGELLDAASSEYLLRYSVKPGITGWAQVNGARGELVKREDLRKRIDFDLEYIRNWSLGFDFKIILLTAMREIISKHAF